MNDALHSIEGERIEVREPIDPDTVADEEVIDRLAKLKPMDYDRVREAEAKKLGVRVGTLDTRVAAVRGEKAPDKESGCAVLFEDIEPWPDDVDGGDLLDTLASTCASHVVLPPGGADAIALWVLHCHAHGTTAISPILAVTSPTPECGKTTLLTVLGALVPKPLPASNITAAALFRAVEKWRPTLLVDEADTFLRDNDELRGVINSGHNRASSFVIRTTGDDHEPRRFTTWAPKAIALIGKLPATLASRAVHIELRRIGPGEAVSPIRGDRLGHLRPLARKAVRWVTDHGDALRCAEPDMPGTLLGRRADNWRHLLAIADEVGGEWPQRARRAADALTATDAGQTGGIVLLDDLRALFDEKAAERLSSGDIVQALGLMEDRPWSEWKAGKPITARQVARLLEPFGVTPTKFRAPGYTPGTRGYERGAFDDAFARYLSNPPLQSATAPQPNESATLSVLRSATPAESVADAEGRKPKETATCGAVADAEPQTWGVEL